MPGKPIKLVTCENGQEVQIGGLDPVDGDILFIDPFVWNLDDIKHCKADECNIVRKRRSHWGRDEPKGFYLLSAELKNQEA